MLHRVRNNQGELHEKEKEEEKKSGEERAKYCHILEK